MPIKTVKLIAIIACAILPALTAFAQQNEPQKKQDEPIWVENSGFKGKIFEIKNREPRDLVQILQPLGSGFKGSLMKFNGEYKTITVRDFPENIATIAEAITRLDVQPPPKPPQAPREPVPDVEVNAHILIASNSEIAGNPSLPALADVIKQLQATLNYKSYQLLTSIVQRTRIQGGAIEARGMAEMPDKSFINNYHLQIQNLNPETRPPDFSQISLNNLQFYLYGFKETSPGAQVGIGETRINTKLSVRDGEKVIVGTASLRDKAVILVLTVKILK